MAFNIQTVANTNAVEVAYNFNNYSSMTFVNTHATAEVTIDLFIRNAAGTIVAYFLNNVKIPNGASLKLEQDEFSFSNNLYTLFIDSDNSAGAIDIISRKKYD
tara:strand:+ start:195 stop:503 length:309 start_codon:yes stop_codon:yes gene_type:complete